MTILKVSDKIIKKGTGEVYSSTGSNKVLLHIDTDLQQPNRIIKDGSNLVRQITDKAKNVMFVQPNSTYKPINVYPFGLKFSGVGGQCVYSNDQTVFNFDNDFWIEIIIQIDSTTTTYAAPFIIKRPNGGSIQVFLSVNTTGANHIITCQYRDASNTVRSITGRINIGTNIAHIVFARIGAVYGLFTNGYFDNYTTGSGAGYTTPASSYTMIGTYKDNYNYPLNGTIYLIKSYSGTFFINFSSFTSSNYDIKYFEPKTVPFNFITRYKNDGYKKLFISSKYLKDAVINTSNEIESIKSSLSGTVGTYSGTKCTIDGGIKNTATNGFIILSNNPSASIGTNALHVSAWIKIDSFIGNIQYYLFDNSIKLGLWNYTNTRMITILTGLGLPGTYGDGTYDIPAQYWKYGWNHICGIRMTSGRVCYFINGILVVDATPTIVNVGYSSNYFLRAYQNVIDDILYAIGDSIINPTGKSIGQKCYEPPRRVGFDGIIKTY